MDCTQFLSSFTDYRDDRVGLQQRARIERHLADCPSCRRYCRIVEEGVRLLRALPPISVSDDFRPRLRHRIYHVEDGEALSSASSSSGVSAVVAVSMAVLLALAAWSPLLRQHEEVRLPAIVVTEPPDPVPGLTLPPSFRASSSPLERPVGWTSGSPWEHPTALLLEYSPLLDGHRRVERSTTSLD